MADLPAPLVDVVPPLTWFNLVEGGSVTIQEIINITNVGVTHVPQNFGTFAAIYVNAPGVVTLTMPVRAKMAPGQRWTIKDISGSAGVNTITVNTPDGTLIDGQASITIALDYGALVIEWDGTAFAVIS